MTTPMILPRIVLAGTHSGVGKTSITAGLILALRGRGMTVQPFKAGPDYIDPGFHSHASGRTCRNLDTMLLAPGRIREIFQRAAADADISVVEGVMGLYDGAHGERQRGSTAHLAKLLGAPVVLIIDASSMAQSAGAVALGYARYDRGAGIAGFILNRIASERHYEMARESIERVVRKPVFGYLSREERMTLPERHLGLVPAWEDDRLQQIGEMLRETVERRLDIEALIDCARTAGPFSSFRRTLFSAAAPSAESAEQVTIAYAADEAFRFYYQDNLDIIEQLGGRLVPFSPLRDHGLPEDAAGVYIGGGFPELFAERLAGNTAMLEDLRGAVERGIPLLAECGGLMYLVREIVDFEGNAFPMAAVLPGRVRMQNKLRALGYCTVEALRSTPICRKSARIKGHVFHWSDLEDVPEDYPFAFRISKGDRTAYDGLCTRNALASYVHIHFGTRPSWAKRFVERCRRFAESTTRRKRVATEGQT